MPDTDDRPDGPIPDPLPPADTEADAVSNDPPDEPAASTADAPSDESPAAGDRAPYAGLRERQDALRREAEIRDARARAEREQSDLSENGDLED